MKTAFAPGRVNLIGEHTDYTGGLVLPVALDVGVTMQVTPAERHLRLNSVGHGEVDLRTIPAAIGEVEPSWLRYVLAAAEELGVDPWMDGFIESTLPTGGTGLSSSTALTCAALLCLGGDSGGDDASLLALAELARRAEIKATGVQIGIMDQAACLAGRAGSALLLDCQDLQFKHVTMPDSIEVLVAHSGQPRQLADSEYNDRRLACEEIEQKIGPLRTASFEDARSLGDAKLMRRALHVVSENKRVESMVEAFASDDPALAGEILLEGHESLAKDYEVSTPVVDAMVDRIAKTPGVFGARMTGGGFGGSIVALCHPGTQLSIDTWWTKVSPSDGARLL